MFYVLLRCCFFWAFCFFFPEGFFFTKKKASFMDAKFFPSCFFWQYKGFSLQRKEFV